MLQVMEEITSLGGYYYSCIGQIWLTEGLVNTVGDQVSDMVIAGI